MLVEEVERRHDAGELQRGVHTYGVGRQFLLSKQFLLAHAPLVGTVQVDVECLAAAEGVALGKSEHQFGAHASCGAPLET